MASIEEKVEEYYKTELDSLGIKRYAKTEKVNDSIDNALKNANSKSGNRIMETIILIFVCSLKTDIAEIFLL